LPRDSRFRHAVWCGVRRGFVLVVGMVVAGAEARADVVVEPAAGACTTDAIRARIAALADDAPLDDHRRVHVAARARRVRCEAQITFGDDDRIAPRTVEARTCDELATSVALVIVISLRDADATAVAAPRIAAPPPAIIDLARTLVIDASPRARDALPPTRATPLALAVVAGAAAGLDGTPAAVLGGSVRRGRAAIGIELAIEADRTLDVGDGGRVHLSRRRIDVTPCVHLGGAALCGLGTVALVTGRGEDLVDAAAVRRPVVALGGRAAWTLALGARLAVRFHVDGAHTLGDARFRVDQMPVWGSPAREVRVGAGVVAHFP